MNALSTIKNNSLFEWHIVVNNFAELLEILQLKNRTIVIYWAELVQSTHVSE